MSKRSKIKKRQYKSDSNDIIDLVGYGVKANIAVSTANTVLNAVNNK